MLLKQLATVSMGVLLFFKTLADDKESYSSDLTRIESDTNKLNAKDPGYRILTPYRVDDFFAFDATALGPTSQKSAIFGAQIAPCTLQRLVDPPLSDTYVFSAALELAPASLTSGSEKNA